MTTTDKTKDKCNKEIENENKNDPVKIKKENEVPKKTKPSEKILVVENEDDLKKERAFCHERFIDAPEHDPSEDFKAAKDDTWWILLVVLTLLGIISRLHYITVPKAVVWDETHFGKMASWYINRTYFFDVHPPGGKLLIAFLGYLCGYNGTFEFKTPGDSYEGYEEILLMRMGCALIGAGLIPLSFLTAWELTRSLTASGFAGLFCCCEIGILTLSRFILLDPILMFFMMASFHAFAMFHREHQVRQWSLKWWLALCYIGISMGLTMSVKFAGLFIVLVVGLYTAYDLWIMYCDITKPLIKVFLHFIARVLCLILLPVSIYIGVFFIHDQTLTTARHNAYYTEDLGTATYSSAFQKRLINSSLYEIEQPAEVSYGSVVTLRNQGIGAGYLHSHNFTYPEEYKIGVKQQVTLLKAKDSNNRFRFLFPLDDPDLEDGYYLGEPESILHDNWIRIFHENTNATVAAGRNKSTIASKLLLIYGRPYNLSDPSTSLEAEQSPSFVGDLWRVKIENGMENDPVKPLQTRFQLINSNLKCALTWSKENLPAKWGFAQQEAACTRNFGDIYSFWSVETVVNPYAKNSTFENVTISFWERFIESHSVMTFMNSRLKPQYEDMNADRPWMWPILYKGFPWLHLQYRIVLLGNPLLFLMNFLSLVATPILLILHSYRSCRSPTPKASKSSEPEGKPGNMTEDQFIFSLRWLFLAYLFNYVPFYTMHRILYFHHYFPAQSFACILSAVLLSQVLKSFSGYFPQKRRRAVLRGFTLSVILAVTLSFLLYCYVGYGTETFERPYALHNSTFRLIRFNEDWLI